MAEMNPESSGLLRTNGGDATTPATAVSQQQQQQQLQQQQLSGQKVISQQVDLATAAAGGIQGEQKVVISLPGQRQITVPLSTLQVKIKS